MLAILLDWVILWRRCATSVTLRIVWILFQVFQEFHEYYYSQIKIHAYLDSLTLICHFLGSLATSLSLQDYQEHI